MGKKKLTLDKAMEDLDELIEKINSNEIPLEEAVKLYKKGIELSEYCNNYISDIEGEVKTIRETSDNKFILKNFETPED